MYRLPVESAFTPWGLANCALVAGPPSPEKPGDPVPATLVIVPSGATLRMRWFQQSAMYKLPALSTAMPCGLPLNWALVPGPPSPEKPGDPVPATRVNTPLVSILKMTGWSGLSKYTFPAESTATPHTWGIVTEVAGAAVDGRAPPA